MPGPQFEIAFSGQIAEGADLETAKARLGKVFNADENRLAQMFSGKRVIIKRQVDEATAAKYRGAFQKAGAICEIRPLDEAPAQVAEPAAAAPAAAPATLQATPAAATESGEDYVSRYPESEVVPQALLSRPLKVSGEEIAELGADLAPVGSSMQHKYEDVAEPGIDISGLDIAPVGTTLSAGSKEEPPPPPDTSGLTLAD